MNVVSFYAPRPEHPFYQDYQPYLALLRASCERFGHRHIVLTDDPAVGDDAYVTELPRSLMKAVLAAQLAYLSDPQFADTPTLLTGADCVLAQDPAAFAEQGVGKLLGPPDMVITIGDFADCRMNTGAIFIRRPRNVAHIWRAALRRCSDEWGDDQVSLYEAIEDAKRDWLHVEELPVDPYNLAPRHPGDDCRRGVVLHFRGSRKAWMVDYCHHWLDLGDGVQIDLAPNTGTDRIVANINASAGRGLEEICEQPAHDDHAILVGGGPSLAVFRDEIRQRVALGQHVFALNGAGVWLAARGVSPMYTVILDPRPDNAAFVGPPSVYLLASQCAPEVFDAAAVHSSLIWHFADPATRETLFKAGARWMVGGGITVGLTAMALAYHMGYRKLHLYGYDSSDADGEAHAYDQSQTSAEARRVEVWCGAERFSCSPAMYAQAKEFPDFAVKLANQGVILTVHGSGLLPSVARGMNAATSIEQEFAV